MMIWGDQVSDIRRVKVSEFCIKYYEFCIQKHEYLH